MARVRLTTDEQLPWIVSGQRDIPDEERAKFSEGELESEFRIREAGTGTSPSLAELRYGPNSEIKVHSHDADEIIYILEGTMRINNRMLGPGTTITIPGGTFYGFHAGPEGLRMLNFRPCRDTTFNLPPAG